MDNFSTLIPHLPSDKAEELKAVLEKIVGTGKAEIVILFGSYARGDFKKENESRRKSDFDLLVICSTSENKKEITRELSQAFNDIPTAVQLVIEPISRVNANLEDRQYFFSDIRREGIVLYDSKKETLAAPILLTPARRREIAREDFQKWFHTAGQFFQTGIIHMEKNWNQLASFSFQQAVEMCYTTVEMVFAHYNPHEHNLAVLRERAGAFDKRINLAFPITSEEQVQLFDQLNFAYIGGRYRTEDEFPVTRLQLTYWKKELEKLLELTDTICNEYIERLPLN